MSETKWTPGPWEYVKASNPGPQQENDCLIVAIDGMVELHVAETFQHQSHKQPNGPSEANARLIAAAPDLLDALTGLINSLPQDEIDIMRECIGNTNAAVINRWRTAGIFAIAKATGKSDD